MEKEIGSEFEYSNFKDSITTNYAFIDRSSLATGFSYLCCLWYGSLFLVEGDLLIKDSYLKIWDLIVDDWAKKPTVCL